MASISSSFLGTRILIPKTVPRKSYRQRMVTNCSRPLANFHPSVLGDLFLGLPQYPQNHQASPREQLEEVKWIPKTVLNDYVKNLETIDAIQRLGIAYHFREEIDHALQNTLEKFEDYCKTSLDLHVVALSFRLLRQHGYGVTSGVFKKFMDSSGDWTVPKLEPVKGMFEVFEATHLRVRDDGDILDRGFVFTRDYLSSILSSLDDSYIDKIHYALKISSHWRSIPREEARHYIAIYEKLPSHDPTLLRLAKMDFNHVQYLHQEELNELSRWWMESDIVRNFPYVRDRLPELYVATMTVYFEPEYAFGRMILCKAHALTVIMDDTFDAYGTYEELKLLTEAIERWDISCLDQLPNSMKPAYDLLLRTFAEIEDEMTKQRALYRFNYVKQGMKTQILHYLAEVEWRQKKHTPTMDEYMYIAEVSSAFISLVVVSFIGMGDLATKEVFEWVFSRPRIIRASMILARLISDMAAHEHERKRDHIPSAVECYTKQYNVGKQEAIEEFNSQIEAAWKDINQAFLGPNQVLIPVLDRVIGFVRLIDGLYKKGNWITEVSPKMKTLVKQLLVDPIPDVGK